MIIKKESVAKLTLFCIIFGVASFIFANTIELRNEDFTLSGNRIVNITDSEKQLETYMIHVLHDYLLKMEFTKYDSLLLRMFERFPDSYCIRKEIADNLLFASEYQLAYLLYEKLYNDLLKPQVSLASVNDSIRHEEVLRSMIDCSRQLETHNRSDSLYQYFLRVFPDSEYMVIAYYLFHKSHGNHREGRKLLHSFVAEHPQAVDAWREIGSEYIDYNKPYAVIRTYRRIINLDPDDVLSLLYLGYIENYVKSHLYMQYQHIIDSSPYRDYYYNRLYALWDKRLSDYVNLSFDYILDSVTRNLKAGGDDSERVLNLLQTEVSLMPFHFIRLSGSVQYLTEHEKLGDYGLGLRVDTAEANFVLSLEYNRRILEYWSMTEQDRYTAELQATIKSWTYKYSC
ncbi:MAG: hypothetical protein K8S56_09320, partial [Candidatus Cloacimonetes bacterium]|nr:hypothetical protein [Candidatus Cloacimonadota bacterium]